MNPVYHLALPLFLLSFFLTISQSIYIVHNRDNPLRQPKRYWLANEQEVDRDNRRRPFDEDSGSKPAGKKQTTSTNTKLIDGDSLVEVDIKKISQGDYATRRQLNGNGKFVGSLNQVKACLKEILSQIGALEIPKEFKKECCWLDIFNVVEVCSKNKKPSSPTTTSTTAIPDGPVTIERVEPDDNGGDNNEDDNNRNPNDLLPIPKE